MSQQKTAALMPAAPEPSTHPAPARSRELRDPVRSSRAPCAFSAAEDLLAGNTQVSHLLSAIHQLTEALVSPIRLKGISAAFSHPAETVARLLSQVNDHLSEWRLPELPRDPSARELSLDDSLLRYELAWVHLACDERLPTGSASRVAQTAQRFEEMLDQHFKINGWRVSPFTGLIQASEIAAAAGMISTTDADSAIRGAFAAACRNDAWRILRVSVQHIAAFCGFPRWDSTSLG